MSVMVIINMDGIIRYIKMRQMCGPHKSGLTRHVATDAGLSEYIVAAELRFPLPPPAGGQ